MRSSAGYVAGCVPRAATTSPPCSPPSSTAVAPATWTRRPGAGSNASTSRSASSTPAKAHGNDHATRRRRPQRTPPPTPPVPGSAGVPLRSAGVLGGRRPQFGAAHAVSSCFRGKRCVTSSGVYDREQVFARVCIICGSVPCVGETKPGRGRHRVCEDHHAVNGRCQRCGFERPEHRAARLERVARLRGLL